MDISNLTVNENILPEDLATPTEMGKRENSSGDVGDSPNDNCSDAASTEEETFSWWKEFDDRIEYYAIREIGSGAYGTVFLLDCDHVLKVTFKTRLEQDVETKCVVALEMEETSKERAKREMRFFDTLLDRKSSDVYDVFKNYLPLPDRSVAIATRASLLLPGSSSSSSSSSSSPSSSSTTIKKQHASTRKRVLIKVLKNPHAGNKVYVDYQRNGHAWGASYTVLMCFVQRYCSRGTLQDWITKSNRLKELRAEKVRDAAGPAAPPSVLALARPDDGRSSTKPTAPKPSVTRFEKFLCAIFSEIVDAMKTLHDYNIAHRDLKPDNIGVDEEGHIKILDFGLIKCDDDNTFNKKKPLGLTRSAVGGQATAAPEADLDDANSTGTLDKKGQLQHKYPYDPKLIDVWQAGCTLYCLSTGIVGNHMRCKFQQANDNVPYWRKNDDDVISKFYNHLKMNPRAASKEMMKVVYDVLAPITRRDSKYEKLSNEDLKANIKTLGKTSTRLKTRNEWRENNAEIKKLRDELEARSNPRVRATFVKLQKCAWLRKEFRLTSAELKEYFLEIDRELLSFQIQKITGKHVGTDSHNSCDSEDVAVDDCPKACGGGRTSRSCEGGSFLSFLLDKPPTFLSRTALLGVRCEQRERLPLTHVLLPRDRSPRRAWNVVLKAMEARLSTRSIRKRDDAFACVLTAGANIRATATATRPMCVGVSLVRVVDLKHSMMASSASMTADDPSDAKDIYCVVMRRIWGGSFDQYFDLFLHVKGVLKHPQ